MSVTAHPRQPPPTTAERLVVVDHRLRDLSHVDLRSWRKLLENAVEPNPFLSPEFVLSLAEHIDLEDVTLTVVKSRDGGDWRALGAFQPSTLSWREPLVFSQSLTSLYSFVDGMILDRTNADEILRVLFDQLMGHRRSHGLQFSSVREDSPLAELLESTATEAGVRVVLDRRWERATFRCEGPVTADQLLDHCSRNRRRSLRRARRWLNEQGKLTYRLVTPADRRDPCVHDFLRLEHFGWKGAMGTSLASDESRREFFLQLVDRAAESRMMLLGELALDGTPIAITANLRSNDSLHAFKIGWDPAFADGSIGYWSELELAAAVSTQYPEIKRIDSSSKVGSYLEAVWPERQALHSVTYAWSRRAQLLVGAKQLVRRIRKRFLA